MRKGRRTRIARCAVGLASIVVLMTPTTARAAPVIRGLDTRWSPTSVVVERRSVVRWRGVSSFHDVVAFGGNWTFHRQLPVGSTVKVRFRAAGTYRFRCTYHSTLIGNTCYGMCGAVVVSR
jgi:plastocyanin